MYKRELTKESLAELAMRMPVLSENVQSSYVGKGTGNTVMDPLTFDQYRSMGSFFISGWVDLPDSISLLKHPYDYYFGGSGYDGMSGYWGGSGYDGMSGYLGGSGSWDGNSGSVGGFFPSMDAVANMLSSELQDLYDQALREGWTILFVNELSSRGQTFFPEKTIKIRFNQGEDDAAYYSEVLSHEILHYYQDKNGIKGMVNGNHSPLEYQTAIIDCLNTSVYFPNWAYEFGKWKNGVKSGNTIYLYKFLAGVDRWYEDFVNFYIITAPDSAYGEDKNFVYKNAVRNLNWEQILRLRGYNIVYE